MINNKRLKLLACRQCVFPYILFLSLSYKNQFLSYLKPFNAIINLKSI